MILILKDQMASYPTNDILYKIIRNGTKGAVGLPLNVQVVGKAWQEEMVLHVMSELERAAKYSSAIQKTEE